ncbi:MAG TPA: hypothetical protein DDW55_09795 [Gammaproteobacteria bacterium]|nr:hypothetical protein [Gammaproteobacteria bacterium]
MKLNDKNIRALAAQKRDKKQVVADGAGLCIEFRPGGRHPTWIYRYSIEGKRETFTLGRYPDLTLKRARELRLQYGAMVVEGNSPARAKRERKAEAARAKTLQEFFDRYRTERLPGVRKNITPVVRAFENDILPTLGKSDIRDIGRDQIMLLLLNKKSTAPTMALAVHDHLNALFTYAVDVGALTINPMASIKKKVIHNMKARERHLTEAELSIFLPAVYERNDQTSASVVELLLLTGVRKRELQEARWSELDLDKSIWHIPAARMKMGSPHTVYLSTQAGQIFRYLKEQAALVGSPFVFPNQRTPKRSAVSQTYANNAIMRTLKMDSMADFENCTAHDLRMTFSTRLSELGVRAEIADLCIAHKRSAIEGVYNRAQLKESRVAAMQLLGNEIDRIMGRAGHGALPDSNVVPLRG